jgi:hypothetical protein
VGVVNAQRLECRQLNNVLRRMRVSEEYDTGGAMRLTILPLWVPMICKPS